MDKGKEKATEKKTYYSAQFSRSTYKWALEKDEKTLRKEALKAIPEEEHLREDAYNIAVSSKGNKEYVYPYIPITTCWISPIEKKYTHLSSEEVMTFYLKNFTDPFLFPKDFMFYQEILVLTGSVQFDSTSRTTGEWAYSKAYIHRVITPEIWEGDLYSYKELRPPHRNKINFNYFDYMKAWDISFCYDNRQRKHSWFIQFKTLKNYNFPNWFLCWFLNWGLYPLILPKKVRNIYEDFVKINPSIKIPSLMFAVLYQVPWIMKWDVIVTPRKFEKYGVTFENVPYLGRRILIKWWDKFDFFTESIFSSKGIINLEPIKPTEKKADVSEILKELLTSKSSSSKKDLKRQLKELLSSSSSDTEEEEEDKASQSTEKSDPMLQDSQSL